MTISKQYICYNSKYLGENMNLLLQNGFNKQTLSLYKPQLEPPSKIEGFKD